LAGGLRSQLRDELGSARGHNGSATGMLVAKYSGTEGRLNSLVHEDEQLGESDGGGGGSGSADDEVFWGGVSKQAKSVVPVVLRRKEQEAARAGRAVRAGDWRRGAPVSIPVNSWSCYDGAAAAGGTGSPGLTPYGHQLLHHAPATPSRPDSYEPSQHAGGGQHGVLGSVPTARPVTAPEHASRTNRVLTFASPPHKEGASRLKPQQQKPAAGTRKPGAHGKRLPNAPDARPATAATTSSMNTIGWVPPASAEAMFPRMQTTPADVQVRNLDFAALSTPVLRALEHPAHGDWCPTSDQGRGLPAKSAEDQGAEGTLSSARVSPYRQPVLRASLQASSAAGQDGGGRQRPSSGVEFSEGRSPVRKVRARRPKTASTDRHYFLTQAREIVKDRAERRRETDSPGERHTPSVRPAPPSKQRSVGSPGTPASAVEARRSSAAHSPSRTTTAGEAPPTRSPTRPQTASGGSPRRSAPRMSKERAFPAPEPLSVAQALSGSKVAAHDKAAGGHAQQAPSASPKTSLAVSRRVRATADPPPTPPPPPPPPLPPPPLATAASARPGVRVLDSDEARGLGKEEGRARAARAAISAARARIKGGDVVGLDELDALRLQKHREMQESEHARRAQADAELEYQQTRADRAALAIQSCFRTRRAREALRWRYWHAYASVIQRAVRCRRARAAVWRVRHAKRLRQGVDPPGTVTLAICVPPAPALVHAAVEGSAATDVVRHASEVGAARRGKLATEEVMEEEPMDGGVDGAQEEAASPATEPGQKDAAVSPHDSWSPRHAPANQGPAPSPVEAQASVSSASDSLYLALLLPAEAERGSAGGNTQTDGREGEGEGLFASGVVVEASEQERRAMMHLLLDGDAGSGGEQ